MNATELEKFYTIGNVEGLAFVDVNQALVENQMMVSQEVAGALAQSFSDIFGGLEAAQRPCKGFLVRTRNSQFLGLPVHSGVVILQLNTAEKVDGYFREAVSIIGSQMGAGATASVAAAQVPATQVTQPARPGQAATPAVAAQTSTPAAEDLLDLSTVYEDFVPQVMKALTKVAPSGVAKKIFNTAAASILGDETTPSSREQIVAIGKNVLSTIPNEGRRKMVQTELELIAERLGLNS